MRLSGSKCENRVMRADPDGSIADMGAFPYLGPRLRVVSPNGGEN